MHNRNFQTRCINYFQIYIQRTYEYIINRYFIRKCSHIQYNILIEISLEQLNVSVRFYSEIMESLNNSIQKSTLAGEKESL